jgi:hypothetical protein
MRNALSRMSVGLLTLALCGLVSSRVLAQPVQPKQMPPTPPAPNRAGWDLEANKKLRVQRPAPVVPTPSSKKMSR